MNRQLFYQYLDRPGQLNDESLRHLTELVTEYPYFQAGRMLLVKNLHLLDHIRYNHELKQTAAHIPDRKRLFFLVHSDESLSHPPEDEFVKSEPEKDLRQETPVDSTLSQRSAIADYFDVADEDASIGNLAALIQPLSSVQEKPVPKPVILPAADLLDYEMGHVSKGYQLSDEPFDPAQNRSFSAWLEAMKMHQMVKTSQPNNPQQQIIDNFLNQNHKIIEPSHRHHENKDIAQTSAIEREELMTETLANIHIKQKHYEKAIEIFEKLSLKYPEKSIYFATRIKELENQINNL